MYKACLEADISKIDALISLGANKWNLAYEGACMSGNLDTVKYVISKIPNNRNYIEDYLSVALMSGNMDIINYIILRYGLNLTDGSLFYSCKSGNIELVKLMISAGVSEWFFGLNGALEGGHRELAELMITLGASDWTIEDWNIGLRCAYLGGQEDLVDLMYNKGAKDDNNVLFDACISGNINLVKKVVDKGNKDWRGGIYGASIGGHLEIVKFMLNKTRKRGTLNNAVKYALNKEQYEIGLLLLHEGAYYNGFDVVFNAYLDYILKKDINKVAKRHSVGTWLPIEVSNILGKPKMNTRPI